MSDAKPRTDISGYFNEISHRLKSQVDVLTPIINHSGEMGDNDHLWFADLIRQHMPNRIGVDTGFVVNHESDANSAEWFSNCPDRRQKDKSIGPQSDILLLDILHNTPLCSERAFRVCPAEMVLGVIEVTRFLNSTKLNQDLEKIKAVRTLGDPQKKHYRNSSITKMRRLRPRAYIVGLDGSISFEEIESQVSSIEDSLRPNAILVLNKALYIRNPGTTDFFKVDKDVLFQFIAILRMQIEEFPIGSTDLRAYLPGVAKLLTEEAEEQDAEAASEIELSDVPNDELQSYDEDE